MPGNKKRGQNLIIIAIALASLLLMGQTGCEGGTGGGTGFQSQTSASKFGLDFSLIQGVGSLYSGAKIAPGDSFNIALKVENYDSSPKSGELCIKDNIDNSAYGGVVDSCKSFFVKQATYEGDKLITPGSSEIIFPDDGTYMYNKEYPITQQAKISIKAKYVQTSTSQGTLNVPGSTTEETISLNQKPEIVRVDLKKSMSLAGSEYKVNFAATLTNGAYPNSKIYTSDFKNPGLFFKISASNHAADCSPLTDIITLDNTRLIKCFVVLPKEEVTYPLLVNLVYGVEMSKDFSFTIQKEEAA